MEAEVRTSRGRIDAVVEVADAIYLFEFKLDGDGAEVLAQIVETEYYRRYSGKGKPLVLVGVNFSTESRSVAGWHVG